MKTFFRFLMLFALLLIGYASAHAQTSAAAAPRLQSAPTDPVVAVTEPDLNAPELQDACSAQAAELAQLKNQVQTLMQAYNQLVATYNAQNIKLQQLEQQQVERLTGRSRAHRVTAMLTPHE